MQQVEVHYLIHIRLLMLDISTTKSNSSNQFISTSDSRLEVRVPLDEHKQLQLNNLLALASAGKKQLAVDTDESDEDPASVTTGSNRVKINTDIELISPSPICYTHYVPSFIMPITSNWYFNYK